MPRWPPPASCATCLTPSLWRVKTFDELYSELQGKAAYADSPGNTRRLLDEGVHEIGRRVLDGAAEAWMAAEHAGRERAAEEIAGLLYHVQVLMLACDVRLSDVYERL